MEVDRDWTVASSNLAWLFLVLTVHSSRLIDFMSVLVHFACLWQETATPSPDNAVSMLLTLESGAADQPSQQFANIGSGQQVAKAKANLAHGVIGSQESPTAVSRLLNGQHTFTHHLYHHYDADPGLRQRHDRTAAYGTASRLLVSASVQNDLGCQGVLFKCGRVECCVISFHFAIAIVAAVSSQWSASFSLVHCGLWSYSNPLANVVNGFLLTVWLIACCCPHSQLTEFGKFASMGHHPSGSY